MEDIPPYLFPFLAFGLKFIELTLMSIRIICVAKGYKKAAFIISFLESVSWLMAISIVLTNLSNILNGLAYALGMATGSYMGIILEKKLALGLVMVRIITQKEADVLLANLRKVGFRVTDIDARSNFSKVKVLFATVKVKNLKELIKIVRKHNPNAFFTIEEVKEASLLIKNPDSMMVRETLKNWQKN